jgi:hypothetical protein
MLVMIPIQTTSGVVPGLNTSADGHHLDDGHSLMFTTADTTNKCIPLGPGASAAKAKYSVWATVNVARWSSEEGSDQQIIW